MPSAEEPTSYLVARLRDALAHDERTAALDITIRIVGNDVFLMGAVTTDTRRTSCEQVIRELLPEHTVHSQLVVIDQHAPSMTEELT
jgi:osmotically-inducible protein OsmY